MRESLQQRAQRARSRAAVRAWEYRQRKHSKGVWFRLRRVLADAESAFAIGCSEVERLKQEGYRTEPVGAEIEPPKMLLFVPAARLDQIPQKRRLRIALDAESHSISINARRNRVNPKLSDSHRISSRT